jgi:copper chaperone CopZ
MMSIKPRKNGFSLVPAEEERNDETLKQEIGEVSSVSTSFTDKIKQQLPIAPPIVPIKPPPLMGMNFPNGEYHPDFMFCGACVTCEEPDGSSEAEMGGVKQLEAYLKQEDTMDASTVSNTTLLETKLQVRSTSFHSSQILMIKSLLQPLSGVANVTVDGEKQLVTVQHDASLSDKRVLDALNSIGHSATLQDQSSACSIEVRSQFFVAGICCTSEVPTVRRILRPVPGVSRIQINITTKVVHVCHDSLLISAQQISSILTNQGFPSQIRRDGQAQANPKLYAPLQGQTTLLVNSDISNDERPVIEQSLLKLKGIFKVELDFQEKLIFIDHDVYEVSSEQIVEQLRSRFDCRVMTAGEQSINDVTVAILDQIGRSKYVESTLLVERLRLYSMEGIKNAIFHTYIQKEVRAIYPNISSETIKIEHDPSMVSIMDIVKTLEESDITAAVTLDGRTMNLYLPTEEDNSPQNLWDEDVSSVLKVHFNVWLSGGFWVLSMLSYKGEL